MKNILSILMCIIAISVSSQTLKLPNKTVLSKVSEFENESLNYLSNYRNVLSEDQKSNYFLKMDNLIFELGKTDSLYDYSQINNLIEILKAYNISDIKIVCLSDKRGDLATNFEFTQKRADFIKKYLLEKIPNLKISTIGMGESFAKIPETGTDEEQLQDKGIFVNYK
jgi:outer membrane protein OmpA-like peptidoglycan-associated protein